MAKIITENFRVRATEDFYNTLNTDNYFVMGSCMIDNDEENEIKNSLFHKTEFLNRVIFGNRVDKNDARFLFTRKPWIQGTIYDYYDDRKSIEEMNMYVSVLDGEESSGVYRVYKCIDNNNGAVSTVRPNVVVSNDQDDGFFITGGDGYTWKYMFSVPASSYDIYQTRDNLPYEADINMINNASDGIRNIIIESTTDDASTLFADYRITNSTGIAEFNVVSRDAIGDTTNIRLTASALSDDIRSLDNAYVGMYLEVDGQLFDIISSTTTNAIAPNVEVYMSVDGDMTSLASSFCKLLPKVTVSKSNTLGDAGQCKAVLELDAFGGASKVKIVQPGEGYTIASAKVSLPQGLADKTDAVILRPIISPVGGHGFNPILELGMSKVSVVTNFYSSDDTLIPTSGTYTEVGLVRSPEFTVDMSNRFDFDNRLAVTITGDVTGDVANGYLLEQTVGNETIVATVHEAVLSGSDTILYLVDYSKDNYADFEAGSARIKDSETDVSPLTVAINNVESSEYVSGTGEVLHFVDFDSITRTANTKEKIKFVFDF